MKSQTTEAAEATVSKASKAKADARFGLSGPDYPPDNDFGGCRCNLDFRGREAAASMTSEVKIDAKFDLVTKTQIPIFEAVGAI